ncbi:hypothetical protein TCAL_03651 [Tigriopus californicus]|uniref:ELMO domain-containing protein n=2 Tax=Tigriopus californicus TaxID=6832 RepID=A0A553ND48_TIGCA|nr:hypothetical protein TCAL_03651 [Tigriopus californicus]
MSSSSSHSVTKDSVKICVLNVVSQGHLVNGASTGPQRRHLTVCKKDPLDKIIQELCQHWQLDEPLDYALQFEDTKRYVMEKTKDTIANGQILKFCQSPKRLVRELVNIFEGKSDIEMRANAFKSLEAICKDEAVALEFVECSRGLELIVRSANLESTNGYLLSHLIRTFHTVMSHPGLVSWEDERIHPDFVGIILANIETEKSKQALKQDEPTQECSLSILNELVNTPSRYHEIDRTISVASLLNFLQSDNSNIQRNALALFNSLFSLGDSSKKMKLKQLMEERNVRRTIVEHIIRRQPDSAMRYQLYVLQSLHLNLLEKKMNTLVENQDQKALDKIKELRRIAFKGQDQGSGPRTRFSEDYRKLGFKNEIDPTQDFCVVPPGILGLEIMFAFALNHTDQFIKLVLETSCRKDNHDCPLAQITIGIVRMICEITKIGHKIQPQGQYHPMFFTDDNPLGELSAIMINHVVRTWNEMRATTEDFNKVMEVAREQLVTALSQSPSSFEDFRKCLRSYQEITESRKEEAKNRAERDGPAIRHLRESLEPEMLELVQRQRLNFLVSGSHFSKIRKESKDKHGFLFFRLSTNHKSLLYGDWKDDRSVPVAEDLTKRLSLSEIKDFQTGHECTHLKDVTRKGNRPERLALSFTKENGDTVDVMAPDQKTFDMWSDGINTLLRKPLSSERAHQDVNTLLSMEVKVRLLELEGISILDSPPPIPALPSNFKISQDVQ